MKAKRILRNLLILIILGSNIGCDQISKCIVRQKVHYNEQISFVNNYVTLTKVENRGAFLSAGNSLPQPVKMLLLVIFPVAALSAALIYLLTKSRISNLTMAGICFFAGGGIGNIYDRIMYGSVTDFLHIDFVLFQTGIFNMADVSIMTGMVIVLYDAYFNRERAMNKLLNQK